MDDQTNQILNDLNVKLAKIEVHLDNQGKTLENISTELSPLKKQVHTQGIIIRAFSWTIGVVGSFISAKFLGFFS